jgi:O-acetylhomoserine (thiol)-lyase
MQTLGHETMDLRYSKATKTCFELVTKLSELPQITSVNYNGLSANKFHSLAVSQFGATPGAMFTFNLASREACFAFLNKLKLIKRATNLFDNKSLAIHPASTIYGNFTAEMRKAMNVSDCTIRISVGLEDAADLFEDFVQAL